MLKRPFYANDDMDYYYAIKLKNDSFEVRYTIMSMKPLFERYIEMSKDSNAKCLHPNDYYKSMFTVNIMNISHLGLDEIPDISSATAEDAKSYFGADEVMTSTFSANSDFSKGYTNIYFIVIHKKDIADVYISFLSNDADKLAANVNKAIYSMKFK